MSAPAGPPSAPLASEAAPTPPQAPARLAWRRFWASPSAAVGALWLALATGVAIVGYPLLPDDSPGAARQLPALARQGPGTQALVLRLPLPAPPPRVGPVAYWLGGQPAPWRYVALCEACPIAPPTTGTLRLREASGAPLALAWRALLPPQLAQAPAGQAWAHFSHMHLERLRFPLGTDALGRCTLSRLLLGARVSLALGALALAVSLALGVSVGLVAGYFAHSWADRALAWLMAVVWSLPSLLLAVAIAFAVGKGFAAIFLAVGLSTWVEMARIVRGQTLSLRERSYVEAARVMGFSHARILLRHILPSLGGSIAILAAANFATAILLEAGLSFLGLGVRPPTPSWGAMIAEGYPYLVLAQGKWLAIWPGLAMVSVIAALHFVGAGLRAALSPRG